MMWCVTCVPWRVRVLPWRVLALPWQVPALAWQVAWQVLCSKRHGKRRRFGLMTGSFCCDGRCPSICSSVCTRRLSSVCSGVCPSVCGSEETYLLRKVLMDNRFPGAATLQHKTCWTGFSSGKTVHAVQGYIRTRGVLEPLPRSNPTAYP